MKKHGILKFFLVLCLVVSGIILYETMGLGKSDRELIEERIEEFTEAYNTGDYEAVLESLDKKTRNTYKAAMNLGESLFSGYTGYGISGGDLFAMGVGTSGFEDLLKFQMDNLSITGEEALAEGTLNYGEDQMKINIIFVKEGRNWYIKEIGNLEGR